MDVTAILTRLYNDQGLNDCLEKFVAPQYREDFKQELFLILLEKPDKVIEAETDNKLRFYVVRIIINLSRQTRNIFHKKYLSNTTTEIRTADLEYPEENHVEEKQEREKREESILKGIENLDDHFGTFYYRELIKAVARYGSMSETERQVGIPTCSISRAVKKVRDHLKEIK